MTSFLPLRYRVERVGDVSLGLTEFSLETPRDLLPLAHWEGVHPELAVKLAGMPMQTLEALRREAMDSRGEEDKREKEEVAVKEVA